MDLKQFEKTLFECHIVILFLVSTGNLTYLGQLEIVRFCSFFVFCKYDAISNGKNRMTAMQFLIFLAVREKIGLFSGSC